LFQVLAAIIILLTTAIGWVAIALAAREAWKCNETVQFRFLCPRSAAQISFRARGKYGRRVVGRWSRPCPASASILQRPAGASSTHSGICVPPGSHIKLHNAAFKGYIFFAEHQFAILDRQCGFMCASDLGEQIDLNFAELDSITGLNKFLDRLTRRLERGKNRVDHISHLNQSLMASNGLNETIESAKQIL
jgi:hypothetical protein